MGQFAHWTTRFRRHQRCRRRFYPRPRPDRIGAPVSPGCPIVQPSPVIAFSNDFLAGDLANDWLAAKEKRISHHLAWQPHRFGPPVLCLIPVAFPVAEVQQWVDSRSVLYSTFSHVSVCPPTSNSNSPSFSLNGREDSLPWSAGFMAKSRVIRRDSSFSR